MNSTIPLQEGQRYQLWGGGQRVLLHFTGTIPPKRIQNWQSVQVLDSYPFEPEAVLVNLRGPVVWVALMDGPKVATTGYLPLCLFGPRLKLNGKEE